MADKTVVKSIPIEKITVPKGHREPREQVVAARAVTVREDNPVRCRGGQKRNSSTLLIVVAVLVALALLWSRQHQAGRSLIPQRTAAPH